MNYTLSQLQIFLKITQTSSITRASEELNLTQPAVSIQLKNFQDQFKIPLTEVIGRKLFVTEFGKEIASAIENILNEVSKIDHKTLAFSGKLSGKLKIAVVSTGKYVMPFFLSKFIKDNDGVDLLLDVTNKAKVIDSLAKNEIDFALVSVLPNNLQIEKIELLKNKLFLVGNNEYKTNKKKVDKKMLEKFSLIYREEGSATRTIMEKFIAKNSLSVRKKIELTSNEAIKQALLAGLGVSVMPLIGIRNELRDKTLQIIPTIGLPIATTWNLIWLKGKKFSPVAENFINYIKKEKSNIVKEHFKWSEEF
jgi:DNA-binding transcriptional LysR family regulator